MKTLVLGLGNPLLGDDGVGWRVVEQVERKVNDPQLEVDCSSLGGLGLMERLVGYDRAVLVDAVCTGREPPGSVRTVRLQDLANPGAGHTSSAHDASLQTALELGRRTGAHLPADIAVVAIEAERVYEFSEALTPAVEASVPRAVEAVLAELGSSAV
ncbi:MAG: hydrogenase maturation protease [Chloroflexi bacterium]|nr:hydrogenase maturation protease [Chloroflexota bacterium]